MFRVNKQMPPSTESVYHPERIAKISRIMPQFAKVAAAGDAVMMGLEGDPAFPFTATPRPTGIITDVISQVDGTSIKLRMDDGSEKVVNEYSIAPGDVWEYTDTSFENVMERELKGQQIVASRAEKPIVDDTPYRGPNAEEVRLLSAEVAKMKADMAAEHRVVRSFHNTYIMSLKELTDDIIGVSKDAKFSKCFSEKYEEMARAENSIYRGSHRRESGTMLGHEVGDDDDTDVDDGASESSENEEESSRLAMSDYF
tara:strand:- start:2536 stop:3303 length:768 start_codon:yes stop_codon:yes gene_type:complete